MDFFIFLVFILAVSIWRQWVRIVVFLYCLNAPSRNCSSISTKLDTQSSRAAVNAFAKMTQISCWIYSHVLFLQTDSQRPHINQSYLALISHCWDTVKNTSIKMQHSCFGLVQSWYKFKMSIKQCLFFLFWLYRLQFYSNLQTVAKIQYRTYK